MKNHIALKFIAILLCAAALLGTVGSAAGIAVLTAGDMYDKSPKTVYREQVEWMGQSMANAVAEGYASHTLGGCPDELVDRFYFPHNFIMGYYNYILKDAEGNVLLEEHNTEKVTDSREFAVRGKYMYLVSAVLESERNAKPSPYEEDTQNADYPPDAEMGIMAVNEPPVEETTVVPETEASAETEAADEEAEETAAEETEVPTEDAESPTEEAEAPTEDAEAPTGEAAEADETIPETPETIPPETISETVSTPVDSERGEPGSAPVDSADTQLQELPPVTEPVLVNGQPLSEYEIYPTQYYDHELGDMVHVEYVLLDTPQYFVELQLAPGATEMDLFMPVLNVLYGLRNQLFLILALSLLVLAAAAVYLCCAAGRKPGSEETKAGGLNRMPLELYGSIAAAGLLFLAIGGVEGCAYLLRQDTLVACSAALAAGYAGSLLVVGFCFALAAQLKTPGYFWLRNSLCGRCLKLIIWLWHRVLDCIVWLAQQTEKKVLPFLGKTVRTVWRGLKTGFAFVCGKLEWFFGLLPLTWQWLLTGFLLTMLLLFSIAGQSEFCFLLSVLICFAVVIYGAAAFGVLLENTRKMSKGNLNAKIDDKYLLGCFKDFAKSLNALANVAMVAAQKQLKSERMKTELITNVSHDIKTPLTSIISYADLLQKPHTEEEEQQYLEVLGRQSMQLKKLIEDLIEMSKASTGNLSVDITQVDAVEAVNQALGEFADKLDAAQLTPVFRHSDETAPMMADGKLVWRVLHNLLSNAVKYALPGTRLYLDMLCLEGKVILSMKNISRDELNIDAEELMERFVRGDGSRNTEGSGLGLNIAKSMMELQKGSLQLLVDGDLFKVTLIFPGA